MDVDDNLFLDEKVKKGNFKIIIFMLYIKEKLLFSKVSLDVDNK